jgi:uncharacterized protein YndB with AHSA1/START domain
MDKPKLVYETYIRTTSQKLWDAITKPEFTSQYWGGNENVSSSWKTGSKWHHADKDDKKDIYVTGEVLESTPTSRLVLSWTDPEKTSDVSRVTFEIKPMEDVVCLLVTHDNFVAGSDMVGKVSGGWPRVLSSMKSFLETGKGLNAFAGCGK